MSAPDEPAPNRVRALREERGWTQGELARRAGVSRAQVSAVEQRRGVPSVACALRLARALEASVETLFGLDEEEVALERAPRWAFEPASAGPVRYWRALVRERIVHLPVESTAQGLVPHDGCSQSGVAPRARAADRIAESSLVIASCDPALGLLLAELGRREGLRVIALERSSRAALELLRQGVVHAAGVHLARAEDERGNAAAVRELAGPGHALLHVARWDSGIALAGTTAPRARELARGKLRWIGREPGSGARACQDEVLGERRAPRRTASSHRAVGEALRGGWAEAGACLRLVALGAGLRFVSVRTERYDLCLAEDSLRDPRLVALVEAVRSRRYAAWLAELPGYEPAPGMGQLEAVG